MFIINLIKCPMCEKEISPNALSCPNCGEPMKKNEIIVESNIENNIENNNIKVLNEVIPIICPNFPEELSMGKQIANWACDTIVFGVYKNNGDSNDKIRNGKVVSILFTNGLKFSATFGPQLCIHYSQVISAEEIKGNELKDKSSIARAVVGGVVFGPLGAIIGGISGVGTKKNKTYYLAINYWDIETKTPVTISIGCNTSSKRFIDRLYKEKNKIKICN